MTAQQIISEIRGWLIWAIDLALIVILFAMVFQTAGFRIPSLPNLNPQIVVYLFGCRWLMK